MEVWPERGFVGVARCTPGAWEEHAAAIRAAHPVRLVRLTATPAGAAWADTVADHDADWRTWGFASWPGVRFALPPPG